MKRIVNIGDLATEGISLEVTFDQLPTTWGHIQTPFQSVGGWSDDKGKPVLRVRSPRFKMPSEAEKWLETLTAEVKELLILDKELTDIFKRLEGEIEV